MTIIFANMKDIQSNKRTWLYALVSGIIIICAGRWLPHPPNFTPLVGATLFGAAFFKRQYLYFILPVVGLWISDLVLNNIVYAAYFDGLVFFSQPFLWSALAFGIIGSLMVKWLSKLSAVKILIGALGSSVIFFLITNLGAWLASPHLYTQDVSGLILAYTAGLPFLLSELTGGLFYTLLFFGGYYLYDRTAFEWASSSSIA